MTALLLTVSVLLAAEPAPSDEAKAAQAKDLFAAGQKLYKAGKVADAVVKFEEALELKEHPSIYFNLGTCHEKLGNTAQALRSYRDYLRLSPSANDKAQVADAIANLERKLKETGVQQLLVFTEPPTARIEVDGKVLSSSSPASIELPAGPHTLTVRAIGYQTVEKPFTWSIARAQEMTVNLELAPPDAPVRVADKPVAAVKPTEGPMRNVTFHPVSTGRQRVMTWVMGGAAVAALGGGIALGLASNGSLGTLRGGEPKESAVAQRLYDDARGFAIGANIAYGVAITAAVTAVVLFFVEGNEGK